jgi:hypothetical protein
MGCNTREENAADLMREDLERREQDWQFRLDLRVFDKRQLHQAALERALEEGLGGETPEELLGTADEPDIGACLTMLLDPGSMSGCSIGGSETECVG